MKKKDRITYSVDEVAQMLGISRGLAYEMVARGELPSVRLGRRLLIPCRAFERWLDEAVAPQS